MSTYFTKCGRTFEKSTKAETTGYHLQEDDSAQIIDQECAACPFVVDVTDGWPDRAHKRYECRAGNKAPNHTNEWSGSLENKNTISIYSLDHEFCEAIIAFSKEHPDLGAGYTQDRADCRRSVSVSCSGNKKGMAAKRELIEKFFPAHGNIESCRTCLNSEIFKKVNHAGSFGNCHKNKGKYPIYVPDSKCKDWITRDESQDEVPDVTETEETCGNCTSYDSIGGDIGTCMLTNKSVSRVRPGCGDFDPDVFDEEELGNMDLEGRIDTSLETADSFIEKVKTPTANGRSCGDCHNGHWYSGKNTYANVVQDDGIKTVKRPCEAETHYCYQFEGGQRKIAADKDFDSDTAPDWCPLREKTVETSREKSFYFCAEHGCPLNDGEDVCLFEEPGPRDGSYEDDLDVAVNGYECKREEVNVTFKRIIKEMAESEQGNSVNKPPESMNETVPDIIKPVEVERAARFNYDELDDETIDTLRLVEGRITKIRMQTVYDIGKLLKMANDQLAKAGHGTFGAWAESIGFSRSSALNYIQAYDFICTNFAQIEDAAGIQPSLLFAASKPSAPPELSQAVVDGDITKHKDYVKALENLKEAEKRAELAEQGRKMEYDMRMANWNKEVEIGKKLTKANEALSAQQTIERDYRKRIGDLEQQIDQLKNNADSSKQEELDIEIQEKQDLIRQHEQEIAELREQLNAKPIEVPAVEVREIIPYKALAGWIQEVQEKLLEMLDEPKMNSHLIFNHESGMSLSMNIEWENVKEEK